MPGSLSRGTGGIVPLDAERPDAECRDPLAPSSRTPEEVDRTKIGKL